MKVQINISATIDQPELLDSLVAKLAIRRDFLGFNKEGVPTLWEAFETSSIQTFIAGTMMFNEGYEILNIPFTTQFLFSCSHQSDDSFKVAAGFSLS